jgi:hypothetical protein
MLLASINTLMASMEKKGEDYRKNFEKFAFLWTTDLAATFEVFVKEATTVGGAAGPDDVFGGNDDEPTTGDHSQFNNEVASVDDKAVVTAARSSMGPAKEDEGSDEEADGVNGLVDNVPSTPQTTDLSSPLKLWRFDVKLKELNVLAKEVYAPVACLIFLVFSLRC